MTKGLLVSRKRKEKLFNKSCQTPNFTNVEVFKEYNKLYNKYFRDKFLENDGNTRATWATLRKAVGTPKKCSKLPRYFKVRDKKVKSDNKIAVGFNNFLFTIGSNLDRDLSNGNNCFKDYLTCS